MSSGAGHKTFGQIWADTAQFCVPIGAAATVILVAILGGTRLLEVGLAAGAVTVVVLTTVVAFLRLSRGAAGIPRGAIRCGDLVGGWLVWTSFEVRFARRGPSWQGGVASSGF